MLKVGITGGIGAGKSVVCSILNKWGIPVFYADTEARNLMHHNSSVKEAIIHEFGGKIYNESGILQKNILSDIIFNDEQSRLKINSIVHPFVRETFIEWSKKQSSPYVVEEAAILFESGADSLMDQTVVVYSDKEIRIKRIQNRNQFSRSKIENIISHQMSEEEKCKKADYIIYNNEKALLVPQLIKLHNIFKNNS